MGLAVWSAPGPVGLSLSASLHFGGQWPQVPSIWDEAVSKIPFLGLLEHKAGQAVANGGRN